MDVEDVGRGRLAVEGRRQALIVANDQYEHEGLRRLLSPGADADALGRVLGDPQIGGFEVQVVRNEPAHVISTHIEDLFSEGRPDDVLLLHFSCHGLKSESGQLFFAAANTLPNRLGSTAVSAEFVQHCMHVSRSRSVVLLLDCCYGGAFSQGVSVRAAGDVNVLDSFPSGGLGGGRGRAVITASSAMEYAFEGDRLADEMSPRPSVFTSALVEGLATGDADRDEDGWVSLNELYDYVFDRVRQQNPNQSPSRDVEMQGELYLARSRRRRVRPQPIPADLRAAMTDPNMFTRLGAVTELRSRLASDNLAIAAGAYEALKEIVDTDIQYVADVAAAAMREAEIQPVEGELRLGGVTVDVDRLPAEPAEDTTPVAAPTDLARSVRSWRRRLVYAAGVAVLLAAAGTAAALLFLDRRDPSGEGARLANNEFSATSPWRLVIRQGGDKSCVVTLTNKGTGEQNAFTAYAYKQFQMHDTGKFRWERNDSGCLVTQRPGAGLTVLPFAHKGDIGDTEAFTAPKAPGKVTVQVLDFHSYGRCEFVLRDAADGGDLDFATTQPGSDPPRLDPNGRSQVYLAGFAGCDVRILAE